MLIRISLIVAILAGLGVAGIAFFPLQDQIKQTIAARDDFHTKMVKESQDKVKAQNLAKATQDKLDQTKTELASTKTERDNAKSAEAEAEKKADDLQANLKKTQQDLEDSQNSLAAWKELGIPIAQAREILNSLKQVREEKDALEAEKAIIYAKAKKLEAKLKELTNQGDDPELPEGLSGKVLVVDPRYDFVVLNIGEKQGVLPRGKLYVSRNGKLVGKLVISDSIQANNCVATVMDGWKQSDVMEGDQVYYLN